MKVIKCINNNVAICLDAKNREVVAFGKGIGFKKPPYDISLSQIERTYYDVDTVYLSMINDLSSEIIEIADEIIDYARVLLNIPLRSNVVFTLADHLNFSIQRFKKHMNIKLPIVNDVEQLFENEMKVGIHARELIKKKMGIYFPKDEAAYIALHLVNSEEKEKNSGIENDEVIEQIVKLIEEEYNLEIDRNDFNYSRFVSHMHYLFKRGEDQKLIQTENEKIYQDLIKEYPKTYDVSQKVSDHLEKISKIFLTDEEKLYLMLHINRLCTREDCYR